MGDWYRMVGNRPGRNSANYGWRVCFIGNSEVGFKHSIVRMHPRTLVHILRTKLKKIRNCEKPMSIFYKSDFGRVHHEA